MKVQLFMSSKRSPFIAVMIFLGPVLFADASLMINALADGPRVEEIAAGIGQRGTSFDIKLSGSGFVDGSSFLFYRSGLTCNNLRIESDSVLSATLTSTDDCGLGSYPFRIQSKQGVSELQVVRVVPLPLTPEIEPNDSPAQSQLISAGNSAVGVLASGDIDCYKMSVKRGQRLSAEIESVRLASRLTDMKLSILNSQGKVIASADDTPLGKQDPYVTLIADEDADFVIKVEASGIDGNDNSRYALHLGSFPRPDFVFPLGAQVDQLTTLIIGGDSTVQWTEKQTFKELGTVDFYPTRDGLSPPTPIPFRVSPFENALEVEPNDSLINASSVGKTLPIAFNGIISHPGDKDHFRFQAEAGWTIEIAAFAAQLGSQSDTVIRILTADGVVLTTADDSTGQDSGLVWDCPSTGQYVLQVTDKRRSGGERYVYRMEVRKVEPTIAAFLPRRDRRNQSRQSVSIPQGNRVLGFIGVRRQRWTGDAEIDFPRLPKGTKAKYGRVNEDEYVIPVVFEADADAPIGAELVPVFARAYLPSATIVGTFEQPIDLIAESADRLYQGVNVNRLAMAVVEPAPYKIRFEQPPTELPRDGSLELLVHVEREQGFEGAIDVTIPFLPTWVDGPEKITIEADKTSGVFELRAHPDVEACTWPTVAEAKPAVAAPRPEAAMAAATGQAAAPPQAAAGPMRRNRGGRRGGPKGSAEVASQLIDLVVAESPIQGEIGSLMATPGTEIQVTIPLTRSGELPADLKAALVGLPSRVSADSIAITETSESAVFKVRLAEDAPLGFFANLICELTGDWNGQKITYRVGRGGSVKIVRPGELVIDANGRPLTQLEILRTLPPDGVDSVDANSK